ncbi:MAG TPA: hypothetical protein DIW17_04095 [Clostridiales bacterium]|nr:hypothetical protein [Clostridiales bacterium]
MSSYKIYLTKSSEVAQLIARARREIKTEDLLGVSTGAACSDERIPAIYHGQRYFYCAVEYENKDYIDAPAYELIIC